MMQDANTLEGASADPCYYPQVRVSARVPQPRCAIERHGGYHVAGAYGLGARAGAAVVDDE